MCKSGYARRRGQKCQGIENEDGVGVHLRQGGRRRFVSGIPGYASGVSSIREPGQAELGRSGYGCRGMERNVSAVMGCGRPCGAAYREGVAVEAGPAEMFAVG
jgi:hypothetical protein